MHPEAAPLSLAQASVWSPLTSAHWAEETLNPSAIDPELLPLVQQAMPLVMPQVELAARRAWVPGKMDGARSQLSDPWERAATDDGAGYSRVELEEVLTAAFGLVLARQWTAPPSLGRSQPSRPKRASSQGQTHRPKTLDPAGPVCPARGLTHRKRNQQEKDPLQQSERRAPPSL